MTRLVQSAADAEEDDDEEEDEVPVKPSLHRPGKRGGRSAGAVSLLLQEKTTAVCCQALTPLDAAMLCIFTDPCLQVLLQLLSM